MCVCMYIYIFSQDYWKSVKTDIFRSLEQYDSQLFPSWASPAECHQCESHELPWSPPQVPHNTSDFHPLLLFQCFRAAVRLLTVITLQSKSTTLHCGPLTKSNSNCSLIEKKAPCKTGNPQSDFQSTLMKPKGDRGTSGL